MRLVCRQVVNPLQLIQMAISGAMKMLIKKVVSALFVAGMIGAAATPLPSMADADFNLNFGPPAAQVEVVPGPRQGYVWSPGYYNYENNRHVWVNGESIREREGYTYQPNRWVERDGRWNLERGRWDQR
jgi:WXXGXW repeat (2 copies)